MCVRKKVWAFCSFLCKDITFKLHCRAYKNSLYNIKQGSPDNIEYKSIRKRDDKDGLCNCKFYFLTKFEFIFILIYKFINFHKCISYWLNVLIIFYIYVHILELTQISPNCTSSCRISKPWKNTKVRLLLQLLLAKGRSTLSLILHCQSI